MEPSQRAAQRLRSNCTQAYHQAKESGYAKNRYARREIEESLPITGRGALDGALTDDGDGRVAPDRHDADDRVKMRARGLRVEE